MQTPQFHQKQPQTNLITGLQASQPCKQTQLNMGPILTTAGQYAKSGILIYCQSNTTSKSTIINTVYIEREIVKV